MTTQVTITIEACADCEPRIISEGVPAIMKGATCPKCKVTAIRETITRSD